MGVVCKFRKRDLTTHLHFDLSNVHIAIASGHNYKINTTVLITVLCAFVLAGLVNLPSLFELKLQQCFDSAENVTRTKIRVSNLRRSKAYLLYYRYIFRSFICTNAGPFLVILLMSVYTIKTVYNKINIPI